MDQRLRDHLKADLREALTNRRVIGPKPPRIDPADMGGGLAMLTAPG
jgi:hypothetical protein